MDKKLLVSDWLKKITPYLQGFPQKMTNSDLKLFKHDDLKVEFSLPLVF